MIPSGKKNKDFEEPTSSKKSKKGAAVGKGKSKQDAKDEKEKKRRSSLTDSALTSSSSSSASTASRDSDDINISKRKSDSPNYKASDNENEENSNSADKLVQDLHPHSNQQTSEEDKSRKSKNKKKKKKKSIDETSPDTASGNNNVGETGDKHGSIKTGESCSEQSRSAMHKKESSPLLLNSNWTLNPLMARQSVGERAAYSTATQLMGTNTVSSVNSRMSYLNNNFVNSATLLHTFSSPSSNVGKNLSSEVSSKETVLNSHNSCKYPKLLFSTSPRLDEMVNHVERDNVLNIFSNQNKQLQKFEHKWVRKLHQSITDGDYKSFLRKIRIIMVALCRKSPKYRDMTVDQLAGFIIQEIVSHFYNDAEQTTILMALVSTRDITKGCGAIDHGFCRIAQTILHYLSPKERQTLLTISTKRCGKTALHLAVTSGSSCQLEVLLNNYAGPNALDKSGRAALHYAIERNNLEMVKLLMWYGADIALCPKNNFHHPPQMLSIYNLNATLLAAWLNQRINALHTKFQLWIKNLCGDLLHILNPISNMHFVRFCTIKDIGHFQSQQECSLDLRGDFPKLLNQPNVRAILFLIPVFFNPADNETSAESPQFMRTCFPDDISLCGKAVFGGSCISNTLLDHVFSPVHNSHIYAFALPSKNLMEGSYKFEYNLKSTTSAFGEHSVNYPIMALRVLVCRDIDQSKPKLE